MKMRRCDIRTMINPNIPVESVSGCPGEKYGTDREDHCYRLECRKCWQKECEITQEMAIRWAKTAIAILTNTCKACENCENCPLVKPCREGLTISDLPYYELD